MEYRGGGQKADVGKRRMGGELLKKMGRIGPESKSLTRTIHLQEESKKETHFRKQ